jgi:hypothetical protein
VDLSSWRVVSAGMSPWFPKYGTAASQ